MSNIPNVSSVYRDLAHIYSNTGFMSKNNEPINYHLDQRVTNEKTSFEQLYSYKQKRHNQLMSRLHNSSEEHQKIVGGFQSPKTNSYGHNQNEKSNMATNLYQNQPLQYCSVNVSGYNSVNRSQKIGSFVMPKIKYRHIEDIKNNNQIRSLPYKQQNQTGLRNKQTGNVELQKEFYQDMGTSNQIRNINEKGNIKNNMDKQQKQRATIGMTQTRSRNNLVGNHGDQEDLRSQISNRTNAFVRSNKNEKYQDKIQSYYELCRKNLTNKVISNQNHKQQKFMRGNLNKNKTMKLDQAIKLLSID